MLRLIAFFSYFVGFLICSVPTLSKMKKLDPRIPVAVRDATIHKIPQRWSSTIMKITGSTIIVEGEENLPEGPALIVCNHVGDFDIPVLLSSIKKPFGFISKIEVSKVPILSDWMAVMNCVFLDRADRRQAIKTIKLAIEKVKMGHSLILFPEGTRSKGGPMGEFKTGGFRIAVDGQVPIVPIAISGTADVFEKNNRLVRPATIKLKIAKPIESHLLGQVQVKDLAEDTKQSILENLNK
ncbi:1-acyl-sn-glycerol-3-phosphate acyltransferase [Bacillus sp. DNRA2]|uniref:lysophospholipid acyltransferase family protein n=1 Tax=Bacillus sp. DNRA2 TaxID=2723053 RepID=UPI00145FB3A7|nr:lysophospholipid acyltransferase family protein [Bacillus sp. DNRA2]NMD72809.1 1-acyl-sn-glycerol-3-phosphate acyltransferase [Bacillus sp. DNRA2]